jgi:hypothetical protein
VCKNTLAAKSKNGVVGKIGKKIPTIPIPKKRYPKIYKSIFLTLSL